MPHRSITQWNQWLNKSLGQLVLQAEKELLQIFLSEKYGKHAVLIGVPQQRSLIKALDLPCHLLLTPLPFHKQDEMKVIESSFYELPVSSASVDVVILPHTLELVDNPRQLLTEACRIVKPEGHLILCGFNPYSLWGLSKVFMPQQATIPVSHSLQRGILKKWLHLSDFELVKYSNVLYSPPLHNAQLLKRFHFLEWLGNKCHLPCGAVYVLMAQAKIVPLTPIRLRWKQSLASIPVPTSISRPSARNSR